MRKYRIQKALLAAILGTLLAGAALSGCQKDANDPPPYKGQPGDKLPQASGAASAGGTGTTTTQSAPQGATKASSD